jgi:hypothetical protein
MKCWIVLIILVVLIALAAITTPLWLTPFLDFVGANASVIQGLQSLVQLLLWIAAGGVALFGYWRRRKEKSEGATLSTHIKTGTGAVVGTLPT